MKSPRSKVSLVQLHWAPPFKNKNCSRVKRINIKSHWVHTPVIAGSTPVAAANVAVVQRLVYLVAIQKMPVRFRSVAPVNVRVVELVDTPVLETGAERRVGSSPTSDTIKLIKICLSMRTDAAKSSNSYSEIQVKRLMIDL